jgi:hypothetical protein
MYPADLAIPMVAPEDLGHSAGRLLTLSEVRAQLVHVEGPKPYSSNDVARAFASALGREVEPDVIPESRWHGSFKELGFSDAAASSYARMTKVSVEGGFEMPEHPTRGPTTLESYITTLVARAREVRPPS